MFIQLVRYSKTIISLKSQAVIIAESTPAVNKLARQFIPALPGFVPVYIRSGDTPLEDINPDLAEAFNSYAQKHAWLDNFGRAKAVRDDGKIHVHIDDSPGDIDENIVNTKPAVLSKSHHIQKIPRS